MNIKDFNSERYDIARIMAENFHINGEGWDDSDFEWTAHCLQMEGYHKQEWISGEERLPEESGEYLCYSKTGICEVWFYSSEHKRFSCYDGQDKEFVERYSIEVSHWMPLPEAPKQKGGAEE